jgi:peptide/nickel transport system permease protein
VTGYIVRRILVTIPMLLVLSILMFVLIEIAPGDPTVFFIPSSFSDVAMDMDEFRAKIRHELGLDQPLYVQYLSWLSKTVRGDLGYAFTYRVPVTELIAPRISATVLLQLAALMMAVTIAIPVGIISATRQYSLVDHLITFSSFLGISLPNFWLALLLILFVAVRLRWLPSGGAGLGEPPLSRIPHFILPTLVLATEYIAWYVRFMRSSTLDVLRADYVTTARSKGLTERRVLYRHILKNALLPLITVVGLSLPRLVGGAIIVESIFAWPGLGRLAYDAVLRRDQPVIMALTLLTSATIILSNLVVDILYVFADPRISYDRGNQS